eukprot:15468530-Alexandrium_andersonii.AAC.1
MFEQGKQLCQLRSVAVGGDSEIQAALTIMVAVAEQYIAGKVDKGGLFGLRDQLLAEAGFKQKGKSRGSSSSNSGVRKKPAAAAEPAASAPQAEPATAAPTEPTAAGAGAAALKPQQSGARRKDSAAAASASAPPA